MSLSKTQQVIWEKSRAPGSGGQAVGLSDDATSYLLATIVRDLDLQEEFPGLCDNIEGFFSASPARQLRLRGWDCRPLFEKLVAIKPDADMYFACLDTLHKARMKYELILETQPIPTLEQVGPRGLLQYGKLSAPGLAGLLFWRKWFFDIDNRAGQETGYLFEPVIANAIGGSPAPAKKSPVKRRRDSRKGRQIDCLLGKKAYEFKIRVTMAASGQGRWREELDFPSDCRQSGYDPVLVVLDGTPNPKLTELSNVFQAEGGEVFVGETAWRHLESKAGTTMARFLARYVQDPIQHVISATPESLPMLTASMSNQGIHISVGDETLKVDRSKQTADAEEDSQLPDDIADDLI